MTSKPASGVSTYSECYWEMLHHNISSGGYVSLSFCLISHNELVAAFTGSPRMKQTVPHRANPLFLKEDTPYCKFY